MRNYCIINGVNSNTISGLLIQELPSVQKPKMRTRTETIDGRDGDIVTNLGYEAYDRDMKIGLHGSFDIDEITAYFNTSGTVIFSNEPDKVYTFTITDEIDYERLGRFREAKVTFHVQPYKYLSNESSIDYETTYINDSEPYLYRISADGQDIGSQEFDAIVGGTVAWNQMASFTSNWSATGGTYETLEDKTGRLTASASGQQIYKTVTREQNHVYFSSITFKTTTATTEVMGRLLSVDIPSQATTEWQTATLLFKRTGSGGGGSIGVIDRRASGFDMIEVKNPMHFDLTRMFGSTIANYIYSLETAHTGDGVAFFKSLFPNDYYSYDSGTLMSVQTSEHKMVGFNQWDEEWELGGYSTSNGQKTTRNDAIRCKNSIRVLPNTTYYFHCGSHSAVSNGVWLWYDSNDNFIGVITNRLNRTETSPSNAAYLRFYVAPETTYKNDICINISDASKNGTYEPYISHSYPLDSSLTLRGLPKLDGNNKLYYDGDIYSSDGTVTRKYRYVDLGTLTWHYNSSYGIMYANPVSQYAIKDSGLCVCQNYIYMPNSDRGATDKSIGLGTTGWFVNTIWVRDSAYTDATTFKSAMSGVYLVYELATPTSETATPYTNPQIVAKGGTEEYVDNRDVPIPVGHNTSYPSDTVIEVTNNGNVIARPTLTIYGEGTVGLYLNGDQILTMYIDDEYITLDFAGLEAYTGGVLKNRQVTGDMSQFYLPVGTSIISMSGSVSQVLISGYTRFV